MGQEISESNFFQLTLKEIFIVLPLNFMSLNVKATLKKLRLLYLELNALINVIWIYSKQGITRVDFFRRWLTLIFFWSLLRPGA
jgi:hypothetical protein